jgi:hypothetical protein
MECNVPWFHADRVSYRQYYDVQTTVITSWDIYKLVITSAAINDIEGLTFVNTHGQIFPVPYGYTKEYWMGLITNLMLYYRATWISTNGYPFYEVQYQGGTHETWDTAGFDYFMSFINLQGRQCWPPAGYEDHSFQVDYSFFQQVVTFDFGDIARYDTCTLGRPLKLDDFKQNMQMHPFQVPIGGVEYDSVAVLTYAGPGNYSNTHGFGSYVHIGAKKFVSQLNYSSDWERGYVGMAAALWRAASGFQGSESSLGGWQNSQRPNNVANYCIAVCPNFIQTYGTQSGQYYEVQIAFPITVALNESYWLNGGASASLYQSSVQFALDVNSSSFSDVQVELDTTRSTFGNATDISGTVFQPFGGGNSPDEIYSRFSNDIQFCLSFVPVIDKMLKIAKGIQLWSEWWVAPDIQNGTGVGNYASSIQFLWNPPPDAVSHLGVRNGDPIQSDNITEQVSASFYVFMKVPTNTHVGWNRIPLQYNISITPGGYAPPASVLTVQNTTILDLYTVSTGGAGQCDAGQPGDANDTVSQGATPITYPTIGPPVDYYGYLCYRNSIDFDLVDWYLFYLPSARTVNLVLAPPQWADFNLTLYGLNPNLPLAQGNNIQYSASSGYYYVEVGWVAGSGIYKLTVGDVSGGGGCPFVCPWNGLGYAVDNNLLSRAESSNGSDVQDYYMFQQPIVPNYTNPCFSIYSLKISEFENEHDYLNQIKLYSIDHDKSLNVGVSPAGQILTYQNPQPPLVALDQNGRDWTQTVSTIDNNYYQSAPGDCLTLYFGQMNVSNAKLVLRNDPPGPPRKESIHIQLLMTNGSWIEVADIPGRENMTTDILDLSPYLQTMYKPLEARLYFTVIHRVDYVGLDTTPQATVQTTQALMISAMHSVYGNVLPKLILNDTQYAELTPRQQITLTFLLPAQNPTQTRTFMIYIEGHYYTIH